MQKPSRIKKRTIRIKDKKLKALLQNGGRANARRDFFELLRRAVGITPGR